MKTMTEDILVNNNLGAVHPYHAHLITNKLQNDQPRSNSRIVSHRVKCIAPPHLLLDSTKTQERLLWEKKGMELCKDWNEVSYTETKVDGCSLNDWEYKVEFSEPQYAPPVEVEDTSEEDSALKRMKDKWMQQWDDKSNPTST